MLRTELCDWPVRMRTLYNTGAMLDYWKIMDINSCFMKLSALFNHFAIRL